MITVHSHLCGSSTSCSVPFSPLPPLPRLRAPANPNPNPILNPNPNPNPNPKLPAPAPAPARAPSPTSAPAPAPAPCHRPPSVLTYAKGGRAARHRGVRLARRGGGRAHRDLGPGYPDRADAGSATPCLDTHTPLDARCPHPSSPIPTSSLRALSVPSQALLTHDLARPL